MLDWRQAVDEMKHLTRITREKGDTQLSLSEMENYLDHLTTTFTQIENKESIEDIKSETQDDEFQIFVEKQKELITTSYTQAHHFTTVIIFGGYAALFTLWSFTKDKLNDWQAFLIALCIIISLTLYVSLEVYSLWRRGRDAQIQMNELNEAKELNKFPDNYGQDELNRANKFMLIWHYFFIATAFFALTAASLLIYSFLHGLICEFL